MRGRRVQVLALIAVAACGRFGFGPDRDGGGRDGEDEEGAVLWALVHPNMAPDGPGIFAVSFETLAPIGRVPIPSTLGSPHALVFDGASLWLGGIATPSAIFELDPADGAIRRSIGGIDTEGLAIGTNGSLWYGATSATPLDVIEIDTTGAPLRTIPTTLAVINDLTFDGTSLYAASNTTTDPITRIAVPGGAETTVIEPAVTSGFLYAMTFKAGSLFVIDPRGGINWLREIDPATGSVVGERTLPITGNITAIAISASED